MVRPREFDEDEVVQHAMDVFWRQGFQGTSIQDLVNATGLLPGSLYGAFGDKHGLFIKALDAYGELTLKRLRSQFRESGDPVEALRQFIREAGIDCQSQVFGDRGCLMGNTCTELAAHDEVARSRVEQFMVSLRDTMADALRRGQDLGTFDTGRDPNAVAAFIQCSLQGMAVLAKSRPGPAAIHGVVSELLRALD